MPFHYIAYKKSITFTDSVNIQQYIQARINTFTRCFCKLTAKYQKIISTPEHHYIQLNSQTYWPQNSPSLTDICLLNNQEATQKNPAHADTLYYTRIYTKRVLPLPRPCSGIGGRGEPLKEAATYSPALRCSTIGAGGLNFSVRDGKRWNPAAIAAWYSLIRTWSPL